MYQHILVPRNGNAIPESGLREAVRLAAEQEGKLRPLHVVNRFPILMEVSTAFSFEGDETVMAEVTRAAPGAWRLAPGA